MSTFIIKFEPYHQYYRFSFMYRMLLIILYSIHIMPVCYLFIKIIYRRSNITDFFCLDALKHWTNLENSAHNWKVEKVPIGSDPLPPELQKEGFQSCFATTYVWCVKRQIIDLYSLGFTKKMLETRPPIHVSEW